MKNRDGESLMGRERSCWLEGGSHRLNEKEKYVRGAEAPSLTSAQD